MIIIYNIINADNKNEIITESDIEFDIKDNDNFKDKLIDKKKYYF